MASAAATNPALVVGSKIAVDTQFGDHYEGKLFAFDSRSATIVLTEELRHTTLKVNKRVIKTSYITNIKVLVRSSGNSTAPLPAIDPKLGQQREDRAITEAKRKEQQLGTDVSSAAQALMDHLARQ